MDLDWEILEYEDVPYYLLGIFFIVAGLSKFVILEFWAGFEPAIIVDTLPFAADQLTLAGGVFEALIGVGLILRRKTVYFTAAATLWLTAITVQVARLGFWDLAVRDIGLIFYAFSLALYEHLEEDLPKS